MLPSILAKEKIASERIGTKSLSSIWSLQGDVGSIAVKELRCEA